MTEKRQYMCLDEMTDEERDQHRRKQLRDAQRRHRSKGYTDLSDDYIGQLLDKKEKKEKKEKIVKEKKIPLSYDIEYQREYHKKYYEANKEKLLNRSMANYHNKSKE